jgi:hypothetical protein
MKEPREAPLLDLIAQQQAADAWAGAVNGMERAADHAERVNPGWNDAADRYFREFAILRAGAEFRTEEARTFAERDGFDLPPDKRSWGSVARRASLAKFVEKAGTTNTTLGPSHTCPKASWRLANG